MTNELFTEVSVAQQETVTGGVTTILSGIGLNRSFTNFKGLQLATATLSQSTPEGSGTASEGGSAVVDTTGETGNVTLVNPSGTQFSFDFSRFFNFGQEQTPAA
ncbi:CTB family bacteriocin [Nodularia chucula]|uniref:CTB family bacteriocin n=1 Tax=Nodularia chucula TaxID=3093667 RepID=UPI0039C680FB